MNKELLPIYAGLGELVGSDPFFQGSVLRYTDGNVLCLIAASGVGEIYASATTALFAERYKVDALLNFGLVGALNPQLHVGDLAVVNRVVHHQMDLRGLGASKKGVYDNRYTPFWELPSDTIERVQNAIPQRLPEVTLASGDAFVSSKAQKAELVRDFQADICDMEGAAIAIVSAAYGIPLFMLKMVSDNADDKGAAEYEASVARGIYHYKDLAATIVAAI